MRSTRFPQGSLSLFARCPRPLHTYSSLDVDGVCFVFYREKQTSQCMLLITGCAVLRHHAPVCETLTMYEYLVYGVVTLLALQVCDVRTPW